MNSLSAFVSSVKFVRHNGLDGKKKKPPASSLLGCTRGWKGLGHTRHASCWPVGVQFVLQAMTDTGSAESTRDSSIPLTPSGQHHHTLATYYVMQVGRIGAPYTPPLSRLPTLPWPVVVATTHSLVSCLAPRASRGERPVALPIHKVALLRHRPSACTVAAPLATSLRPLSTLRDAPPTVTSMGC